MNPVMRKLKSRRGVAILYALLLFLVCAFVAGATLTAAYQSAARSTLARKEQQAYLAVASAAELIRDAVDGKSMSMDYVETTVTTVDEEAGTSSSETYYDTDVTQPYDGALKEIGLRVFSLFDDEMMDGVPPSARTYDLSFALEGHEELANVAGELTVDENYGVTVLLYNKEGGGNAMRVTCAVSKGGGTGYTGDETTSIYTKTTTVSWSDAEIAPILKEA